MRLLVVCMAMLASAACTAQNGYVPTAPAPVAPAGSTAGRFLGSVSPDTKISLFIALQGQHEDAIDALIQAQNDPRSPHFRRYLSPQQYARYFGASRHDYQEAIATLRRHGFVIDELPANHTDIFAHASASAVSAFFHAPLDRRAKGGRTFFINRNAPKLPRQLHAIAVAGLENYVRFRPGSGVAPNATFYGQTAWGAADIENVYKLKPIYRSYTGKGVTVIDATVGLARQSDFETFNGAFNLHATLESASAASSSPAPVDFYGETTLDVEWMAAVAPGVTVRQVTAGGSTVWQLSKLYSDIVNQMSDVHIVSTSWGNCESDSAPWIRGDEQLLQQAHLEGQWWLAASMDNGSDDCRFGGNPSVDYPASSPYVIGVGGTNLQPQSIGSRGTYQGWRSETAWSNSGGGVSALFSKPNYQRELTPADGKRDVPDVALFSDWSNHHGAYFIYFNGFWQPHWGGTSFAAPEWAAFLGLVQQRYGTRSIQSPLVRLYTLAATPQYRSLFHDIRSGCNGMDGVQPYCAHAGYDEVTGLGSFIGSALQRAY